MAVCYLFLLPILSLCIAPFERGLIRVRKGSERVRVKGRLEVVFIHLSGGAFMVLSW